MELRTWTVFKLFLCLASVLLVFQIRQISQLSEQLVPAQTFTHLLAPYSDVQCSNRRRQERLKEVCKRRGWRENVLSGTSTRKLSKLLASDFHRTVYCYLPKVACTSMKFLLSADQVDCPDLSGVDHPKVHSLKYLRRHHVIPLSKLTMSSAKYRLANYNKVIVVRHPFSRLLSAYMDKIYANGVYVDRYDEVVREFFDRGVDNERRLSLQEFLQLIILKTNDFDNAHWLSYYHQCFPCDIKYDQILKLETIDRDFLPIMDYFFGKSAENVTSLPRLNPSNETESKPMDAFEEFFHMPEELNAQLMSIYERDFELFGYDWTELDGLIVKDKCKCGENLTCVA